METSPKSSTDFGHNQRLALALTGTVALPSPTPASGRVFLGISPHHDDSLPMGSPQFFLKSVQNVSAKHVVTRIFDLFELRAVNLPSATGEEYVYPTRITQLIEGSIAAAIKDAQQVLRAAVAASSGTYEVPLFEDAVLHVRETAPVLMHVVYQYGVTAAECAEEGKGFGCCHP